LLDYITSLKKQEALMMNFNKSNCTVKEVVGAHNFVEKLKMKEKC
jgi:hypothetical protein